MGAVASQIPSLTIVYATVYSGTYQGKHQSSASLSLVRGIHRGPVNSPHKWSVTRKMFPFDDVIMLFMTKPFLFQSVFESSTFRHTWFRDAEHPKPASAPSLSCLPVNPQNQHLPSKRKDFSGLHGFGVTPPSKRHRHWLGPRFVWSPTPQSTVATRASTPAGNHCDVMTWTDSSQPGPFV